MITILVVDDSTTVRMDLTEALEEAGLRVVGAANLAEARAHLAVEPIKLAILDVVLPDGDGTDLLHWLRAQPRFSDLPILMLSSEADVSDRVRGLRIGATDYIGKPYDTPSVIARVRALTEHHRSSRRPILVVDDSATAREMLIAGLQGAGYATLAASDGHEGLQLAARERPSAIVVDGVMPGMDGSTLIRRVRLDPALRSTPCMMFTGSIETASEVEALEAGADAFARKDADIDIVLARLAAMLRSVDELPADSPSLHAPKRVLVVEANRDHLAATALLLQDNGYDVAQSASARDAVELLGAQHVDCVLLSWSVPTALSTSVLIKSAPTVRDTPLVVLLETDDRAQTIEALGHGADDVVPKDGGLELLAARVRAQIRRRQVEDERRRSREQLLRGELSDQLERANAQLSATNDELEAFSYSVSHDLRAPLRAINSFTSAVIEDAGDKLDANSREYLGRVVRAVASMSDMIEALLELSRVGRAVVVREAVDVSAMASEILRDLAQREPARKVTPRVLPGITVSADRRMVRIVLDNLLGNAWKFTSKQPAAEIMVGQELREGVTTLFVRDNGAGFDSAQATQLFRPFKRLHTEKEFTGTGIGLATTRRVVERHGGKIWAESATGDGAAFYFTFMAA